MTPLEAEIRRTIAVDGPLSVAQFMALCAMHPVHGYYVTRDPFGAAGDFVTAPEISQMFGELIGLWAASVWEQMGKPSPFNLAELGPGRGTLMADALRATRIIPGFLDAANVYLIESSPLLRTRQRETLASFGRSVSWLETIAAVPERPLLVIANEFFDALPIHQVVRAADGWHERMVGIGPDNALAFALHPEPLRGFEAIIPRALREAPPGSLYEWRPASTAKEIAQRVTRLGGAALIIDYGHGRSATGETLQAVGRHAFAGVLERPGEVDLTAHVDFATLAEAARGEGAHIAGPVSQAAFLRRLGIEARASMLKRHATPAQSAAIDVALTRLMAGGPAGMGELFKVMAIANAKLGPLPGFET